LANIPALVPFVAGEKPTAQKLTDQTKTVIEGALLYKPFCRMWNNAVQALATSGSNLQSNLNAVIEDTDTMSDTANNRIVIKTAGIYRITYSGAFAVSATGNRMAGVSKNGTLISNELSAGVASNAMHINGTITIRCAVNDALTLTLMQSSGASLNTDTGTDGCSLSAEFVSL
jgi:hypothetical protein